MRSFFSAATSVLLPLTLGVTPFVASPQTPGVPTTPIQHVVVIFGENESFDHYFGTYPKALNPPGQPRFTALPNTQTDINNYQLHPGLLSSNPNLNAANGAGASNPFRLNRTQALTPSQS